MILLLLVFIAGCFCAAHELGAFFAFSHPVLTLCEILLALTAFHWGKKWIDARYPTAGK